MGDVGPEGLLVHCVPQQLVVEKARHRSIIHGECLQRSLHAVVARGLPAELSDVALGDVDRDLVGAHLQSHFAVIEPEHVAGALPRLLVQTSCHLVQLELELVTHDQSEVGVVSEGEAKYGDAFLAQSHVPAHRDVALALTLLETAVVLGLESHERGEDVLVVVAVLVGGLHRQHVFVHTAGPVKVEDSGLGVLSPQVLETIDLSRGDLPRTDLLVLCRGADQPGEEGPVFDQRHPGAEVPVEVLQGA